MSERIINLTNKKAPYNQVGGLMINAYRSCPIQAKQYALCVGQNLKNIQKDACKPEMTQFMNCIKQNIKLRK